MWAFGWLDGPDWGREAERIGQVVSRSPLMSTALDILSIIVHTLCATIVPLLPRQGRVLLALSKSSNFGVLGPETERTG